METLNYEQQHIRTWLQERPLLNISKLEDTANVPKDTIRHFLSERRTIPASHIGKVVAIIIKYGYLPLNQE